MPERRDPPPTDEGWYALHDFRTVDWDAWAGAPERDRQRALEEAVDYLEATVAVADADEGASAVYSILGHKADLLVLHLRPTTADLDALQRGFEQTAFARFTEPARSYVSVTEASGYTERAREYFEGDLDPDSGLATYIRSRLHPTVPDATHVCFYPMDKRRDPDQNWYDLDFAERAEHMDAHGDIGRGYGGKVTQMITGSIGLDDWEWGVTLWADDLVDVKDLLYEMRFDPSTSQFAEFGTFYVGRTFPPADLGAFMAGEPVPVADEREPDAAGGAAAPAGHGGGGDTPTAATPDHEPSAARGDAGGKGGAHPGSAGEGDHPHGSEHQAGAADEAHPPADDAGDDGESEDGHGGGRPDVSADLTAVDDVDQRLATLGLREETGYDPGDYAVICYSDADATDLAAATEDLASNFDHYDRHVGTHVRAQQGRAAAVSIWTAEEAAETAAGFMTDLPGVTEAVGGFVGGPAAAAAEGENEGADAAGGDDEAAEPATGGDDIRDELAAEDVYAGQPHGEDVYALVLYSQAEPATLFEEVADLREQFDHYDSHAKTAVYEAGGSDTTAVVSIWDTQDAADRASDFLADLPGIVEWANDEGEGFGTMGMFYTVKPEYRETFVEKFDEVGGLLGEMAGHRETALLHNREDENDMFIASRWDSKEAAMDFFRSEAFADTVSWGRDVLADRPRHVFLA